MYNKRYTGILHWQISHRQYWIAVQARHQSSSHQNKSLHWTHSFAVKNRVKPDKSLVDCQAQMQVKDLQMIQILPSHEEQVAMKWCMVTLVFRVICKYFEVYIGFKSAVIHHIPHKDSNEMKHKSKQASNSFYLSDKVVVHFYSYGVQTSWPCFHTTVPYLLCSHAYFFFSMKRFVSTRTTSASHSLTG